MFYAPPWYVTSQDIRNFQSTTSDGARRELPQTRVVGNAQRSLGRRAGERGAPAARAFSACRRRTPTSLPLCAIASTRIFGSRPEVEAQTGVATDALGRAQPHALIGVPVSANYDTTDSKLDAPPGACG